MSLLEASGLTRMDFRFESGGAMVIMNNLVGLYDGSREPVLA